ncbi:hypothetical protein HHK36_004983 [Tetracentron sinense]|uniref:Uncharacterized protein n=1 Tax=Tetracentron sinense TaxID=13715 RepID=A0A835DM05_TETSI|nr:hypothetical protein HHK36_004983 [Tetracentron sinense]
MESGGLGFVVESPPPPPPDLGFQAAAVSPCPYSSAQTLYFFLMDSSATTYFAARFARVQYYFSGEYKHEYLLKYVKDGKRLGPRALIQTRELDGEGKTADD